MYNIIIGAGPAGIFTALELLKQGVEGTNITFANAFEIADDVLRRGVQSVSDLINIPAFINLDFADVSTIMKNAGYAHMGVGTAKGQDKAQLAAMAAISSPLLCLCAV